MVTPEDKSKIYIYIRQEGKSSMFFGCVSLLENLDYALAGHPFPVSMHTRITWKKGDLNKVCSICLFCKLG